MYNVESVGLQGGQSVAPAMSFGALANTHAMLYLFQKTEIPTQYRRSYEYNFDGNFTKELSAKMDTKLSTLNGGGWNRMDDCMYGSQYATTAVMPSANSMELNTNDFCMRWSFVLLVKSSDGATPFAAIPVVSTNEIYSGFLIDDPYSAYTLAMPTANLDHSYNPNCRLQITHFTKFASDNSVDAGGYNAGSHTVTGDYDVVSPSSSQQIVPETVALRSLQPGTLLENAHIDEQYHSYVSPDSFAPLLTNNDTPLYVPSRYNDPRQHVGQLVDAMVQFKKNETPPADYMFGGPRLPGEEVSAADVMLSTTKTLLDSEFHVSGRSALDPSVPVSLSELDKIFPDMRVVVFDQPAGLQYTAVNTGAPTRTNILSAVITSALPALLTDSGLSSIGFHYNSWQQDEMGHLGLWYLEGISTLYPATDEIKIQKFNSFKWLFNNNIAPIITSSAGDFYLECWTSLGGTTIVKLKLKNFTTGNEPLGGYVSVDNRLGGLSSPLVGSYNSAFNNATQLKSVITNLAAPEQMVGLPDSPVNPYGG